jgi:hypothetical protein
MRALTGHIGALVGLVLWLAIETLASNYLITSLLSMSYQTNLLCRRAQEACQITDKRRVGGEKREKFPLKALLSADWVDEEESGFVDIILKTIQGDKQMTSMFVYEAAGAAADRADSSQNRVFR